MNRHSYNPQFMGTTTKVVVPQVKKEERRFLSRNEVTALKTRLDNKELKKIN